MIKRFAVIYIGSSKCELVVGQRGKGGINILDRAMYPIDFGNQSFSQGTITFESVYALCNILKEYIQIAQSSAVEEVEILGTAALREAVNREYVLEQIRVFTGGCRVRLLKKEEETELIFKYMRYLCDDALICPDKDTVLTAITSGSITVALMEGGAITRMESDAMGYLKIHELFHTMEERAGNFESLISDYIATRTQEFTNNLMSRPVGCLAVTSHEVRAIAVLCGVAGDPRGYYRVPRSALTQLRKDMSGLSSGQVLRKYPDLSEYQAQTIRHTLMLLIKLMKDTAMEEVLLVGLSIGDAVLSFEFNVVRDRELSRWILDSGGATALWLGQKFMVDAAHNAMVEKIALRLFGALRVQYQLSADDEHLLILAARLLDVGRFVGKDDGGSCGRRIIENTDIIGLVQSRKRVLGRIVDGVRQPDFSQIEGDSKLSAEARLQAVKLTAILKLAAALDKSRKQRVEKIRCHLDSQVFQVTVTASKNIQLEEYFFGLSAAAVKTVYGIEPVLKVKRVTQ
jgi:exopolyphosphatase/guanosine-5'-triphosphate,3'-diphosphate pyrophosphatase